MAELNNPLFDIDRTDLQLEINSVKPGAGLTWSKLFPLKYTPNFDIKGLEGDEGLPVTADRVAFNVKAPLKSRQKIGSWNAKLGKIAKSLSKDEVDVNNYQDLRLKAANSPNDKALAQYLVDLVYDDVKAVREGLDARVEADALRIASSGEQTYSTQYDGDNGTADTINFNIPTENFKGVTSKWANTTADGIADIVSAVKAIRKLGYNAPRYALMEQKAFEQLIAQEKTQKRVSSVLINIAGLTSEEVLSLDNINAYMKRHSYPEIRVIDSYVRVEAKDGSQETLKPFNENVVVLSATENLGYTYWKQVPDVEGVGAIQEHGPYYKITRYSEVNPLQEVTLGEAYVQVGLTNRRSLVLLNTAATTWNNGLE